MLPIGLWRRECPRPSAAAGIPPAAVPEIRKTAPEGDFPAISRDLEPSGRPGGRERPETDGVNHTPDRARNGARPESAPVADTSVKRAASRPAPSENRGSGIRTGRHSAGFTRPRESGPAAAGRPAARASPDPEAGPGICTNRSFSRSIGKKRKISSSSREGLRPGGGPPRRGPPPGGRTGVLS